MPSKTDPARELSDLIRSFNFSPNERFDQCLARHFSVAGWSSEFYEIIFVISSRIDELKAITDALDLDEDYKTEIKNVLETIKNGFSPDGLHNNFHHSSKNYLSSGQIVPLSTLSGLVRPIKSYPKLDDLEQADLIKMIDDLNDWLEQHQLSEQDFIRQALIEGLKKLKFRLERLNWLGWGYTLHGLHDVISAYFVLERGFSPDGSNPPAQAMLKLTGDFVRGFFTKAGLVKETVELGDFMIRAYGAVHLVIAGQSSVAGLLTHGG